MRRDEERLDPLERTVQVLAEGQGWLQKIVAELATETCRRFERVAARLEEMDRRMRQWMATRLARKIQPNADKTSFNCPRTWAGPSAVAGSGTRSTPAGVNCAPCRVRTRVIKRCGSTFEPG